MTIWVKVEPDYGTHTEHRDGIDWIDAPIPHLLHRHRPQTRGWLGYFTLIERCACGAVRRDGCWPWSRRERYPRPFTRKATR